MGKSLDPARHCGGSTVTGILVAIAFAASPSFAGMHKCEDANGKVTYSDKACATDHNDKGLRVGVDAAHTGPGSTVCRHVADLASKTAEAMQQGLPPEEAIAVARGAGGEATDALGILNYVYSFRALARISVPQIAGLAYDKCMAGGFNIPGESQPGRQRTASSGVATKVSWSGTLDMWTTSPLSARNRLLWTL